MQPIDNWLQAAASSSGRSRPILGAIMGNSKTPVILCAAIVPFALLFSETPAPQKAGPEYAADGQLRFPEHYREWVFLSSGVGMTYGPIAQMGQFGPPMFDNIFVNPEAYHAFLETGRWPDKTMLVMEARRSESHASINNGGHFQTEIVGIEANVKDGGTWKFYGFEISSGKPQATSKALPQTVGCYSCHGVKTAVENTFVQFYPSLYAVAESKNTLNPGFERLPITPNKLVSMIRNEGWNKGSAALQDAAKHAPDSTVLAEGSLNSMAYQLMQAKQTKEAVSMLEFAVGRFPRSANLEDSLAEA